VREKTYAFEITPSIEVLVLIELPIEFHRDFKISAFIYRNSKIKTSEIADALLASPLIPCHPSSGR
jgi:hypothetical protein